MLFHYRALLFLIAKVLSLLSTYLKELLDSMESLEKEDAIRIIETALDYAVAVRNFDMKEAYVLYRCIMKLKQNEG